MTGIPRKTDSKDRTDGDKPTRKPPPPPDDEVYESGDIAGPERDRDDEQRDLD